MTKIRLASSAAVLALLFARVANAQSQYTSQSDSPQWLKDRRYTEGVGVRAGEVELHPGIAGEFGYDSNWLLRSTQQNVDNGPPTFPVIPALEFRVTPSLYLSTIRGQRREEEGGAASPAIAFRAGINATWRGFIGLDNNSTSNSANDINQNSTLANTGGAADARLDILPGRAVGGSVFATYGRVILPNSTTADPDISFNQDNIGAGAEIAIQPAAGTLDWHFGYQFATTIFEQSAGQPFNNYTNQAYTRGRWRFRPRTALIYDATLGFFTYSNETLAREEGLVSSTPIRARIGISGLVTDRFALLAMVGWGASFFDNKVPQVQQFDSVIGTAELKWFLTASPGIARATDLGLALSAISLGFARDFQTSYLGNYDTLDRGYLKFDYLFAGRFAVQLQGGVGAMQYPPLFWLITTPTLTAVPRGNAFTDVVADATLFGEYRFTNTFGLNSTLRYTATFSNTKVEDAAPVNGMMCVPGSNPGAPYCYYGMAWQRFEAYIGLRWFL